MATIAYLAERSRKIGLSMQSAFKRGDKPGVAKWALRQADVSTSLAVAARAKADGCLAQVCAGSGVLGNPEGPWAALGDWSLFTGAVMEAGVAQVWIMGEKVAEEANGDAWALGMKYGLEML